MKRCCSNPWQVQALARSPPRARVVRSLLNWRRVSLLFLLIAQHGVSLAQSECAEEAEQAFERQHWEAVEGLLADRQDNACEQRILALARFHLHDFESALPRVLSLLEKFPDDLDLNRASLVMLTVLMRTEEAHRQVARLQSMGDSDFASLYQARLLVQEGDAEGAEALLHDLLEAPDAALAQEAAEQLIVLLQGSARYREVPPIAGQALARDPESFRAYWFEQFTLENQRALRPYDISLGYRIDYDDNVALLPDQQGLIFGNPDEDDYRHVLFADLLYRRVLNRHLMLFAEGHFSHSAHQDLSEFDFTRVNLLAGLGGSSSGWGWRVPVEFGHDRFDGSSFRDTWAVTPGAYLNVWGGLASHLYLRYRSEDYERSVSLSEDRSGETVGGGVLLAGKLGERWFLRLFAEADDVDADGRNWDREEWRVHTQAEFSPVPSWSIGAGFQYQEADFDEVHDVFLVRRSDETSQAFASLSYWFRERWQLRAQVTFAEQQSNLQIYDYDRTVVSLGISRDF